MWSTKVLSMQRRDGVTSAYKGESGRNGYTRVGEHLEYWVA